MSSSLPPPTRLYLIILLILLVSSFTKSCFWLTVAFGQTQAERHCEALYLYKHVLMVLQSAWIATSLSWTSIKQFIPVGSAFRVGLVEIERARMGRNGVPFKTSLKYLGVHLDRMLSMRQHIDSVCRASFLELRRAASNRPYLSQKATTRLVATIIIFHYCSSVFACLPADQTARLQRTQNNAAWLMMQKKKTRSRNMSPERTSLYQIATLAFRHFQGSLPPYLSSSLCT